MLPELYTILCMKEEALEQKVLACPQSCPQVRDFPP